MDYLQALITGIIQGLTEFLPVSSSGHIVLTSSVYKILTGQNFQVGSQEEIFFDIMLHVGTLIAVLIYFRNDIIHLLKVFIDAIKNNSFKNNPEAHIPIYIIAGTFATAIIAYPMKDFFEGLVYNPSAVGIVLIITGTLLYSTEYISSKITNKTTKLNWKKSLIIGIAQGLAVAPGLSRSGSTIAAGLATGLDRVTCARYSFLLSIPIIILATLFHALEITGLEGLSEFNWGPILLGTIISAFVGYFCVKYFIKFISKYKLNVFAYYCWAIGLSMFVFFNLVN